MAAKKKVTETKINGTQVIIVTPNKPLTKNEMRLLSEMIATENARGGVQQVLIPASVDFVDIQEK